MQTIFDALKNWIPNIHKEGYAFILCFVLATFILFTISDPLGFVGIVLSIWCIYFFRDPVRVTPIAEGLVVSPADGLVQRITDSLPPKELEMEQKQMTRISIFLSVFDVHVNRIAVDGVIKHSFYHPGKFLNASLDKASEDNERQSLLIETKDKQQIALVQIAGLIARRIVCDAKEGDSVEAGQRFGIIRFGSRVDIYLPKEAQVMVSEGQTAIGGETMLARLNGYNLDFHNINWICK